MTIARYVDVYYRVDGHGNWTYAGRADHWPRAVIPLPQEGVAGTRLELRLDFTLPESTRPLVVHNIIVRGAERPPTIELITAAIRCADNLRLNTGARERRRGADILAELKAFTVSNEVVTLTDTIGYQRRVLVLGPIDEIETEQDGQESPEKIAVVTMAVFESEPAGKAHGDYAVYGTSKYGSGEVYA